MKGTLNRHCRTEKFKGSFVPNTTKEWNKLPSNLKEEVDFDEFKNEILQNRKCNPLFYAGERKII